MTGTEQIVHRSLPLLVLAEDLLFPGAIAPLHLNTSRTRKLVDDLLDSRGWVVLTVPQLAPVDQPLARYRPVGVLAEVVKHRHFAGGYLLWLLGLARVHLTIVRPEGPYRLVDAVVLEDDPGDPQRAEVLLPKLRALVSEQLFQGRELPEHLDLGVLANLLLQELELSAEMRAGLLLERRAVARAEQALALFAQREQEGPAT